MKKLSVLSLVIMGLFASAAYAADGCCCCKEGKEKIACCDQKEGASPTSMTEHDMTTMKH